MQQDYSRILTSCRRASDETKNRYKRALQVHLSDVDITDFDKVMERIDTLKVPTQLMVLIAMSKASGDARYYSERLKRGEKYKCDLLDARCKAEPIPATDWEHICTQMEKRKATGGQLEHSFYVLAHLMKFHPRRQRDYHLISTDDSSEKNYFNANDGTITFNKFKNEKSRTCGERVIFLHGDVLKLLNEYIKAYPNRNEGFIFTDRCERRFRYLIKKYGLPSVTRNRKEQETAELASGKSREEVSRKFNHSVTTQTMHYVKMKPVE